MNAPTLREGFQDPSISPNDEGLDGIERMKAKPKFVLAAPPTDRAGQPQIDSPPAESDYPKPPANANADAPPPLDLNAPEAMVPKEIVWPYTLKLLHRPTRNTKNEIIHELTVRAPTAGDLARVGDPVRVMPDGSIATDPRIMIELLAQISGVYPPFIEQLDARDYKSCAHWLQGILIPNYRTWETTPS
jgi:hypothetical protein